MNNSQGVEQEKAINILYQTLKDDENLISVQELKSHIAEAGIKDNCQIACMKIDSMKKEKINFEEFHSVFSIDIDQVRILSQCNNLKHVFNFMGGKNKGHLNLEDLLKADRAYGKRFNSGMNIPQDDLRNIIKYISQENEGKQITFEQIQKTFKSLQQ